MPLKAPQESTPNENFEFKNPKPGERNPSTLRGSGGKTSGSLQILTNDPKTISEKEEISFPVQSKPEGETGLREDGNGLAYQSTMANKKLLESFTIRKIAELKECSRYSEISSFPDGVEDPLKEIFALTRRLLRSTVGPLNTAFIQNDLLLEKALWKVHGLLPLSTRLIIGRKRFIELFLDNREHLLP